MDREKIDLFEEVIRLETNMVELYNFYSKKFKEDKEFWKKLSNEERHHASIARLAKEFLYDFPKEILYDNLEELMELNNDIKTTIERYSNILPPKKVAYQYAIDLENMAYEFHYQRLTSLRLNSEQLRLFKKLNKGDKDHALRIERLLVE